MTTFYGWRVVGAAFVVLFTAYDAQYSFGVFFNALLQEFQTDAGHRVRRRAPRRRPGGHGARSGSRISSMASSPRSAWAPPTFRATARW